MSFFDNIYWNKAWTTILINSGRSKGKDQYHLGYTKPLLLDNQLALQYLNSFPPGSALFQWTGNTWLQPRSTYEDLENNRWG